MTQKSLAELLKDIKQDFGATHTPRPTTVPDETPDLMVPLANRLVRDMMDWEWAGTRRKALYRLGCRLFEMSNVGLLGAETLDKLFDAAVQVGMVADVVEQTLNAAARDVQYKYANERECEDGGYWEIKQPKHFLANGEWVARHRKVLYDWLGKPDRPCATCGWKLPWRTGDPRTCINVDHINGVKGDDRLENLRVLCHWCNVHRNRAEVESPVEWTKAIENYKHIAPWERPEFHTSLPDIKTELASSIIDTILTKLAVTITSEELNTLTEIVRSKL